MPLCPSLLTSTSSCCPTTSSCDPCCNPCPLNSNISPVLTAILKDLKSSGNTFTVLFDGQTDTVSLSDLASYDCRFASAEGSEGETVVFSLAHIDTITDTGS